MATSAPVPLYAMRECFTARTQPVASDAGQRCSAFHRSYFWSLVIVVMISTTSTVLRFDNRGEGGIHGADGSGGDGQVARPCRPLNIDRPRVFGAAFCTETA